MKTFKQFVENIEAMQVVAKNWDDINSLERAVKTFLTNEKHKPESGQALELSLRSIHDAANESHTSVKNFGTTYSQGKWYPVMIDSEHKRQKSIAVGRHNHAVYQVVRFLEEIGYKGSYMDSLKKKIIE